MPAHKVKCLFCEEMFDINKEAYCKPKSNRYAHLSCAEKNESVQIEVKKNPNLKICYYCNGNVDVQNEEYAKPVINRYAHKKCYEEHYTEDDKFIDKLYGVLSEVRMDYDFQLCEKQRIKFIKENGYTNEGIYKALIYWFVIRKEDISKAHRSIGIVPYIYNDAQFYFEDLKKKQAQIKKVINKQAKEIKPVVNIMAAERKKSRDLIDIDNIMGEENGR